MRTLGALLLFLVPCALGELLSAAVLFRHGDRSPLHTFPSYRAPPKAWPRGRGQLSDLGARQLQQLGGFLRHRYAALLRQRLPYVRSSHTTRTLASARNCVIGLLQKRPAQVTLESPVRVVSPRRSKDNLLSLYKHCPRLKRMQQQVRDSPEVRSELQPFSDYLTWLGHKAGFSGPMTLRRASAVRDVLVCTRAHNFSMPSWMTPRAWRQLVALKSLSWRLRLQTLGQRRRQGGTLLSRLQSNFVADLAKKKGQLRLYSAHDSNVAALLASAHIFNWKHPPYASAVLVELHSNPTGLEFYYRNDSSLPPFNLTVPGCEHRCSMKKLQELLGNEMLRQKDARNACKLYVTATRSFFGFFFLVTLGLCCAVVVCLFCFFMRRRRTSTARYTRVPMQDEDTL